MVLMDKEADRKKRRRVLDVRDSIILTHDHESEGKGPHHEEGLPTVIHLPHAPAGSHVHHEPGMDILHRTGGGGAGGGAEGVAGRASVGSTRVGGSIARRTDSIVLTHAHELMGKGPHHR